MRRFFMNRHTRGLVLLNIVFFLLATGCASRRAAVQQAPELPGLQTTTEKGVTLSVRYLDEKSLVEIYGKRNNPYLLTGVQRLMVFELQTLSQKEAYINLSLIELQTAGRAKPPSGRMKLSHLWKLNLEGPGRGGPNDRYRGWSSGIVQKRINETMAPNDMRVHKGIHYSGLVAFMIRPPRYGSVFLFVPVFDTQGGLMHTFRFEIKIYKVEKIQDKKLFYK
jgi:hypothetical protein